MLIIAVLTLKKKINLFLKFTLGSSIFTLMPVVVMTIILFIIFFYKRLSPNYSLYFVKGIFPPTQLFKKNSD